MQSAYSLLVTVTNSRHQAFFNVSQQTWRLCFEERKPMNTRLPSINPKLSSLVMSLVALGLLFPMPSKAENIAGDTVQGDLHIMGDLDFGSTIDTPSQAAVYQLYDEDGTAYTVRFRAARDNVSALWEQNGSATPKKKMELDKDNILKLYDPQNPTSSPTVVLDPRTGTVEVKGTLKFTGGSQPSMISVDSNGKLLYSGPVVFNSSVVLQGGATIPTGQSLQFGSNFQATLNESKTTYLDGVLTNLGYAAGGVPATSINKIPIMGYVSVLSLKKINGYDYIAGQFQGQCTIGNSTFGSSESGQTSAFVAKIQNGSALWVKTMGSTTSAATSFVQLAVDTSGNVFVAGSFSGTTTNLAPINNVASLSGTSNGIVVKYSASGTPQWAKVIAGNNTQSLSSISVDGSGNAFVVGSFNGITSTLDGFNLTSAGNTDGLVIKLNGSNGVVLWSKAVGGTANSDSLLAVTVDGSGNVLVGGSFYTAITTLGAFNFTTSGARFAILVKFNGNGDTQWAQHFSTGGSSRVYSIATQSNGDVFAVGNIYGSTTDLGANNIVGAGQYDAWIGKFAASNGAILWTKAIGGSGDDQINSVVIDTSGNVLAGGNFNAALTNVGAFNVTGGGASDGFVIKLGGDGIIQDLEKVGGAGPDYVNAVASENGNILVGGSSGDPFNIGNAKLLGGGFAMSWPAINLVTTTPSSGVSFAWSNSLANGIGSVAVGGQSYAEGSGSIAMGSGTALGSQSIAGGLGALASGYNSMAWGIDNQATQGNALALGVGNYAQNYSSLALGSANYATGLSSLALGQSNYNMGNNSVTLGQFNSNDFDYAVVLGYSNYTYGADAVALGSNNYGGLGALALGTSNAINGDNGIAIGASNTSGGSYTLAVGANNSAGWDYSVVLGFDNNGVDHSVLLGQGNATNTTSVAVGSGNTAVDYSTSLGLGNYSGYSAMALGFSNNVSGYGAAALGSQNYAVGDYSIALGNNVTTQTVYSMVFGVNNVSQGDSYTWIPTDDLMIVGNGGDWVAPSNAFAIHKNGNTRIAGQLEAKGVIRCAKAGDLDMGIFTDGANPADATNGLDAGLRYATE